MGKEITRTLRAALVAVSLVATTATAAAAAPPEAPADDAAAKALARFRRGQDFYSERNFSAALLEFRKAYELSPNYRVFYNIGQVCYQMQDYVCAQRAFGQYLTGGGTEIPEARRQSVDQELAGLKQKVGFLDLTVDVAGAEVSVDDVVVGTTPLKEPLPLSAGRRKLVVLKVGYVNVTRSFDLAGQDTEHVKITLPPVSTVTGPTVVLPPTNPPKETPRSGGSMTALSWVGYGLGAGMLIGGGVTGVLALGANDDVKTKVYANEGEAKSDRNRAFALGITTDALLIGGIVTVAVTTVFTFFVSHGAPKTVGSRFRSMPASASLSF